MSLRVRDKQSARRATTAAQAAVLGLVVCAGAMAVFGLPWLEVRAPESTGPAVGPEPAAGAVEPVAQNAAFDGLGVTQRLGALKNAPVPDPVAEEPVDVAAAEETGDPAAKEVRFIGSVRMGSRAAAFLNVAGVTKLLRPGQVYEGVELVSVTDDEVVVSIDGRREQPLERAERSGPAVTMLTGGAPAPEAAPAGTVASDTPGEPPRFTPDMSREERRAMLLERARQERGNFDRGDRDPRGENDR